MLALALALALVLRAVVGRSSIAERIAAVVDDIPSCEMASADGRADAATVTTVPTVGDMAVGEAVATVSGGALALRLARVSLGMASVDIRFRAVTGNTCFVNHGLTSVVASMAL